jgi:hypothetical protein
MKQALTLLGLTLLFIRVAKRHPQAPTGVLSRPINYRAV